MLITPQWKQFASIFSGFLFPSDCALCNTQLHPSQKGMCPECAGKIKPLKSPQCRTCGAEIPRFSQDKRCRECRNQKRGFSKGAAYFRYNKPLSRLIQKVKYEKRAALSKTLMLRSKEWQPFKDEADIVTSIPMTYSEKFKREVNLSEFFAKDLAKKLGLPYRSLLSKTRRTPAQSQLSRKKRLDNLKGAFRLRKKNSLIRGKNILLVDDVLTTGSTLKEAAECLRRSGARRVFAASLARAGHYEDS